MTNTQAEDTFPRQELAEFLRVFLNGILKEGLTQPLERWFMAHSGPIAHAARAWHAALVAGDTPESSLAALDLPFPAPVGELMLEAAKTGELDYVVEDMLAALRISGGRVALNSLLADYRNRAPGTTICVGCVRREIDRLLRRATAEDANEVIVSWDPAGYMQQRYMGPYVVTVRQPSRESLVKVIRQLLEQGGEVTPSVQAGPDDGVVTVHRGQQYLRVRFEG